ncbi:MAG: cyclic nucleotide-binding domain-containing protein [Hyphomicrobium sp.]
MESLFDLDMLARRGLPLQRFDAVERIFLEHDPGTSMYVVRSGAVDVITFGTVLERVGPGGVFGEMALINDAPRAASRAGQRAHRVAVIDKPGVSGAHRRGAGIRPADHERDGRRVRRNGAAPA